MSPNVRNRPAVLRLDQLLPHPSNVRDDLGDLQELARSIREQGILQPLLVVEHDTEPDKYVILAGHRRAKAAALAGHWQVPCTIRLGEVDRPDHLVVMLIENCQRTDLDAVEKARAIGALRQQGLTLADIARRTGMSQATVSYFARLLDLDDEALEQIRAGRVQLQDAHAAVVEARQKARNGKRGPGRPAVVEPAHLRSGHPLAGVARRACKNTARPRVGGVACGQCWEATIRLDERTTVLLEQQLPDLAPGGTAEGVSA